MTEGDHVREGDLLVSLETDGMHEAEVAAAAAENIAARAVEVKPMEAASQLHDDAFSPLPITWEVDLGQTDHDELTRLAKSLEHTQGDCEVRMLLRDISGQLRKIKVDQRFYTTLDVAQQLEREFSFINPIARSSPRLG